MRWLLLVPPVVSLERRYPDRFGHLCPLDWLSNLTSSPHWMFCVLRAGCTAEDSFLNPKQSGFADGDECHWHCAKACRVGCRLAVKLWRGLELP